MAPRIGLFTRLLENESAEQRYRHAIQQIRHAERLGYHSAWVAQHHFNADEGGLPSPLLLLSAAAAQTEQIRLGTGVITLPHENALRTAEDAAVLDLLSLGRAEIGIGTGASPESLEAFGYGGWDKTELFTEKFAQFRSALRQEPVGRNGFRLQPTAGTLDERIWQATFSSNGASRAGKAHDGLMLSRIQPGDPAKNISEVQNPIVDAYLNELDGAAAPRILASRTVVVVDEENVDSVRLAARTRLAELAARNYSIDVAHLSDEELQKLTNSSFGTAEQVVEQLREDSVLSRVTDVSFQVHSIDPGHELTLRSLELIAEKVVPELGWDVATIGSGGGS